MSLHWQNSQNCWNECNQLILPPYTILLPLTGERDVSFWRYGGRCFISMSVLHPFIQFERQIFIYDGKNVPSFGDIDFRLLETDGSAYLTGNLFDGHYPEETFAFSHSSINETGTDIGDDGFYWLSYGLITISGFKGLDFILRTNGAHLRLLAMTESETSELCSPEHL